MRKFDLFIEHLLAFKAENGHLFVPARYIAQDGYKLGCKVQSVRVKRAKLTEEEIESLKAIHFEWHVRSKNGYLFIPDCFERDLSLLRQYKEKFGNLLIPEKYRTEDGFLLGQLVARYRMHQGDFPEHLVKKLDEIGFVWRIRNKVTSFEKVCEYVDKYIQTYGTTVIPWRYVTDDGVKIGSIVRNFSNGRRKLKDEERKILIEKGVLNFTSDSKNFNT